jgi:hypothetical protein
MLFPSDVSCRALSFAAGTPMLALFTRGAQQGAAFVISMTICLLVGHSTSISEADRTTATGGLTVLPFRCLNRLKLFETECDDGNG